MSPEAIKEVIATYYANMAAMNPEGWVENFAQGAISYDPVGEAPSKVHEGFREFIGQLQAVFASLEANVEHTFIATNEAAVKWTIHGVSKSGKHIVFEGITVFEFNDVGKIQTTRAYWDPAAMVTQLRS